MKDGEWYTVCHTCSAEDRSSDYGDANAFFNRHVEKAHYVEMRNLTLID